MREALGTTDVPRMYGDVPPFMAVDHVADPASLAADVAVVGMPYDGVATFRGGATRRGPQEIRKFSLLFGSHNFDWDVDVFAHLRVADLGDVDVVPGDNARSYARFRCLLRAVQARGAVPVSMGGDHGITYPAVQAVAEQRGGPLGLVVFDTHLDLSESFGGDRLTRASPLLRICELDAVDPRRVAVIGARGPRNLPDWTPLYRELGISVFPMEAVEAEGIEAVAEAARTIATADGAGLYVSIDIDSVDPAYAPGTGTPEVGGLTSHEAQRLVRGLAGLDIVGADLVEVSPPFDGPGQITSLLAANLLFEMLCVLAVRKKSPRDSENKD